MATGLVTVDITTESNAEVVVDIGTDTGVTVDVDIYSGVITVEDAAVEAGQESFQTSATSYALTIPAGARGVVITGSSRSGALTTEPQSIGGVDLSDGYPAVDNTQDRSRIWYAADIAGRTNDTLTLVSGNAGDFVITYMNAAIAFHGQNETNPFPAGTYTHSYGAAPAGQRVIAFLAAHTHTLFASDITGGTGVTLTYDGAADSHIRIQGTKYGAKGATLDISVVRTGGNPNNNLSIFVSQAFYETETPTVIVPSDELEEYDIQVTIASLVEPEVTFESAVEVDIDIYTGA